MTENQLIEGCISGNPLAQRELYNTFSSKMLSVCFRFAGNREDGEDMLQEAFIKVFSQIHSFENRGSFEGWIRRIVVHTCINHLKKHKKFNEALDIDEAAVAITIRETAIGTLHAKQVVECIRQLPIGYRTVLNLYALEGYSHKEIGEILEIGESTSRSQYTRAKNLLEQVLIKKRIIDQPELNKGLAAG